MAPGPGPCLIIWATIGARSRFFNAYWMSYSMSYLLITMIIVFEHVIRLLLLPLFPVSRRNATPRNGKVSSKLFLSHVLAGIVVIFGVLSGEKAVRDEVFISKWAAIALSICVGLLAVLSLLVLSCRQRPDVIPVDEDPSINLQLVFLWGFGLAMIIYLCINIPIYLRCGIDRPDDYLHLIFRLLVNFLFNLFTMFQMVLLTYNKRSILRATIQFHFSIVCILAVNFALWYSSTIHTLFQKGNETEFSNVSCFHSSHIQKILGSKISLTLLPPQMEFYILAYNLLIILCQNSIRYESKNTREPSKHTRDDSYEKIYTLFSMGVKGKHIFAVTLGIFINIPIVLSSVLLDFVYEWQNKSVVMFLDFSDSLSALFSCVLVYVSCIKIKHLTVATTKPFHIRDYILILSSTGMMAYFMIGVVASMFGYTLSKSTVVSRVFGMLETILQTYLLTRSSRHTANGNCRESTCLSFCALILVISNLTYGLLDSYNKHMITKSRYIGIKDWNVVEVLFIPLVMFYRFFSGMGAYSMYKRFKPK